jgi:hypothetical protein
MVIARETVCNVVVVAREPLAVEDAAMSQEQ